MIISCSNASGPLPDSMAPAEDAAPASVDQASGEPDASLIADALSSDGSSACPANMAPQGNVCMDLYEAPNAPGGLPLVMYTFIEADNWCVARGKRLCFDDEWQQACEGPNHYAYPYGPAHLAGQCNDNKTWKVYNQTLLNGWPPSASNTSINSLADLYVAARAVSPAAKAAADHVEWLYQGDGAGTDPECVGPAGVFDLTGNVEEWTRRRDGGTANFNGKLKGRYWAESRDCQSGVITHGNTFRFYEIGFRCCLDKP